MFEPMIVQKALLHGKGYIVDGRGNISRDAEGHPLKSPLHEEVFPPKLKMLLDAALVSTSSSCQFSYYSIYHVSGDSRGDDFQSNYQATLMYHVSYPKPQGKFPATQFNLNPDINIYGWGSVKALKELKETLERMISAR